MTARLLVLGGFAAAIMIGAASAVSGQGPASPNESRTPPRDRPGAIPTGSAVIRGRVLAGDTHRPLRRARVTVAAPELGGQPRNVSTDSDGQYEIKDLPEARYRVTVTRSGYLTLQYGQRRPQEQGKPLQVLDKQSVEHIDFALPRMSLITGRITDEQGDPIEGVTVVALRSMYWEGRRQLVPTGYGMVRTDDAGQYRVLGLTPGTYYVRASTRDTWTVNERGVLSVMGYAPTYFPGTTRAADARRVNVALGQEAANTDLSLVPGRTASISGTAIDSRGAPFPRMALSQELRGEGFASFGTVSTANVAADGAFIIRDVPPGEYKLGATTERGSDRPEAAIMPVVVDSVDVSGVVLNGSAGGTITGTVVTDTGDVPMIPRLRLSMALPSEGQPDPMLIGAFVNPGSSAVAADGSFSIKGVFERARLRVTLPDEWTVKAILHDGRDIGDEPFELKSGEVVSGLQVVLSNRVTSVDGVLADEKGSPVPDGTVLVFAEDAQYWTTDSRFVRAVRPDQQGHFQARGLPPGDYLIVALDYVETGTWNDPEFLESLRRTATKFALPEAGSHTIALKLMSADASK